MDIRIFLVVRTMLLPSQQSAISGGLGDFFGRVMAGFPDYTVTTPFLRSNPTDATDLDVIVYLVSGPEASVFSALRVSHPTGHGGLTVSPIPPGRRSASEVYVRTEMGSLLARVIFHEVLHNKTGMGNQTLHRHASGGVTAASMSVATDVNAANIQLMGGNLGRRHVQWLAP